MSANPDNPATVPADNTPAGVVNCVAYDRSGRRLNDIAIADISDMLATRGTFVWLGLHEPDEALLETLQDEFNLHDLAIEDAHVAHQRTKIEAYGESLFIVVQTAQLNGETIAFGETHIFLGRNYLITVRHGASMSYATVRNNCEAAPDLMAQGPSYGLYAILDFIVDNFMPIISDFREELGELEADIFEADFNRQTIKRLYSMQRELMAMRLAVGPLQDVTNQLVHLHPQLIHASTRAYFRDVYDHVFRVNEATSTMREMLSAAIDISLSLATFTQNEVVKKLAGWAAMLAVPTLVTGWYGMNFAHMPELTRPWAYPAVFGGTVALCGGLYYFLKRARWL